MKKYIKPEIEALALNAVDIICASVANNAKQIIEQQINADQGITTASAENLSSLQNTWKW